MNAKKLAYDLLRMARQHGDDFEVVLQDSPPGAHPDCCKHEYFFIIEEPKDGVVESGMEVVLRTWPY